LNERYGTPPLFRFTTDLVEQLQIALINKGLKPDNPNGLKPTANNRMLGNLKHMFTNAVEWDIIETNALKRVKKMKLFKEPKRLRLLSVDKTQGLFSECDERLKSIVITVLYTGALSQIGEHRLVAWIYSA